MLLTGIANGLPKTKDNSEVWIHSLITVYWVNRSDVKDA
jgi:hypothetical protein